MAVNPKDKRALQQLWDKADEASSEIPDGTYQFEILSARFHMTDKGKAQFKSKLKVVGGDDDVVGKEIEINDNIETEENMGWFKKKLRRLNIAAPEDVEEIIDGTIAEQMKGKTFEGQVKTKNDFMNVYVNRLLSESSGEESETRSTKKGKDKEETSEPAIEEGSEVTWGNGKTGTVLEILADENQARVRKADKTVVRVGLDMLSLVDAGETTETTETTEETDNDKGKGGEVSIPTAEEVDEMGASDVKKALKEIGFDAADIKNPRAVLHGFCTLAHDPKAKIELEEVAPLAEALDVTVKKGADFKDTLKALSKAVSEKFS